jgi:LmbE family N-acetylglucosaminyl deacetylase
MVENINKIDVLAIGIHPDDIELACSGTILKHIDAGYKVGLLDLSRGELGTRGNATIRTQEAMLSASLKIMKIQLLRLLKSFELQSLE